MAFDAGIVIERQALGNVSCRPDDVIDHEPPPVETRQIRRLGLRTLTRKLFDGLLLLFVRKRKSAVKVAPGNNSLCACSTLIDGRMDVRTDASECKRNDAKMLAHL